jgi:hypothetical protein
LESHSNPKFVNQHLSAGEENCYEQEDYIWNPKIFTNGNLGIGHRDADADREMPPFFGHLIC